MPLSYSGVAVSKVSVVGLGTWSEAFGDVAALEAGWRTGEWSTATPLQPQRIPARERRRAPQLVNMAIEVMDQACGMAGLSPDDVAVVFSSSMGDMQITDYMCRALAETPKLISPTKFHNSVHNAAPGYWSITTGAFVPASAISAYDNTASMALLEGAIQVVEESTPVVVVTQEVQSTVPLHDTCPSTQAFSAAFLLAPSHQHGAAIAELDFSVTKEASEWPPLGATLPAGLDSNFGARLLPLLCAIAGLSKDTAWQFPISDDASLSVTISGLRDADA